MTSALADVWDFFTYDYIGMTPVYVNILRLTAAMNETSAENENNFCKQLRAENSSQLHPTVQADNSLSLLSSSQWSPECCNFSFRSVLVDRPPTTRQENIYSLQPAETYRQTPNIRSCNVRAVCYFNFNSNTQSTAGTGRTTNTNFLPKDWYWMILQPYSRKT